MLDSLSNRFFQYESAYNQKIMRRLPIVIRCQLRSFSRLTKNITRPANSDLMELMAQSLLYSIEEINGAVFGYGFQDELNFILKNDQTLESEPWLGNEAHKMVSVAASQATFNFSRSQLVFAGLELKGNAIFDAVVFALPHLGEVLNYLIWRQNICHNSAVQEVAKEELGKKIDKKLVLNLLENKNSQEKLDLLWEHCQIDFETYDRGFRRGVAAYKVPTSVQTKLGMETKNKWNLNYHLPLFYQEKESFKNILSDGFGNFV
jgi:tRNA(His) 5'-end guanylyltransferase